MSSLFYNITTFQESSHSAVPFKNPIKKRRSPQEDSPLDFK